MMGSGKQLEQGKQNNTKDESSEMIFRDKERNTFMKIRSLRTNHLENPLGFSMDQVVLSWTAEESTGKKQRAARIEVSLDEGFTQCIFDSGLQEDISSLGYVLDISLKPRTRYWWRVEVIADDGDRAVSEAAWFETAKMDESWAAEWIRAPFEKQVHPIISKTLILSEEPVYARIYAVGLGVYELVLNGEKVGDEVLAPFYNDYELWVQYQTYDVTAQLHAGENKLDAWLGNGWYKGRFGFIEHLAELYGDEMKLLLEMHVGMPDGSEIVIGTDGTWNCIPSPVLESSIYDGEIYDARLENTDATPVAAVVTAAPKGALMARLSPPLRRIRTVPAEELLHTPAGELVIDFGQLMTGWVEFDCDLPEGAKVFLEHGELLQHDNFYRENLRSALEHYTYISAGKPAHVRPHFTFYGFRFVKVTGLDDVDITKFVGHVIHSDLANTGHLETSNPKVNQLISNAYWGQIGNFVDVPTDCPQRDERMGWTGDAHVFAPTASFNMYTPAFYEKFLFDMRLEQRTMEGSVPHVVPDVLGQIQTGPQGKPESDAHGSCAWGDAATGIPWTLYNFYGDKALLARQYENMKLWTDWIYRQDETRCGGKRLWTCGFHYADWLALDNPVQGSSFGGTDPYYVASAYYYFSADATARAAKVLGYEADAAFYSKLAEEIKSAFQQEFFTATGRIAEPTQTAMIMALHMGLAPEQFRERLISDLRKKIEAKNWHLDTGFVGTYYICRTLSDNGMSDIAYTLLLNEDLPSWLYEVNMGATTVWERWNSVLPNGLVSDTGMNSMNHYAYGSVVEWMYRYMCGINPVEECPGFKKARIAPCPDARFEYVSGSYDSASGLYKSSWKHTEEGLVCNVTVPFDCEAEFVLPAEGNWSINGQPAVVENGAIRLVAGEYELVQKDTEI